MKRWMHASVLVRTTGIVGVVLLAGAVLWSLIAVPLLVRFPSSMHRTTTYEGTLTTFADPATGQLLARPVEVPLTVTRVVATVKGLTTRSREVLDETITSVTGTSGGQTQVEHHRYTIDRKTMRLVGGRNSWAYDPNNQVDRGGTYRLNFPLGTKAGRAYPVWGNEIGASYRVTSPARASTRVRGLRAIPVQAAAEQPVSGAFAAGLAARGLPASVTLVQIKSQLAVLGFDPQALVDAVTAAAGPAAGASVQAGLGQPLPLQYSFRLDQGQSAIEPKTGAVVDTHVQATVTVRIDPQAAAGLKQALSPLTAIPLVQRTLGVLDVLGVAPAQPVYTARYDETPASVAGAVKDARHYVAELRVVRAAVPFGLAGLGFVLLILSLVTVWARRPEVTEVDLRPPRPAEIDARPTQETPPSATTDTETLQPQ